jgi:hypothetical protein
VVAEGGSDSGKSKDRASSANLVLHNTNNVWERLRL